MLQIKKGTIMRTRVPHEHCNTSNEMRATSKLQNKDCSNQHEHRQRTNIQLNTITYLKTVVYETDLNYQH